jgi:short-subunit dehydrogenase
MKNFKNKIILITGATDGIGNGLAIDMARTGANLLLHGRDPTRLKKNLI